MYLKNLEIDAKKVMVCVLVIFWETATLNWDTKLCMTKLELDLTSDTEKHFSFEICTRGGVFYISKWYSKANSKYLTSLHKMHIDYPCGPDKLKIKISMLSNYNFI